jgi:hypothetical protein
MGKSPAETAFGHVPSAAFDGIKLWSKLVRGDADAGDALRLAQNNTPFLNLFYTRMALDYLILYDIQEFVAPGTLRRMERSAKENSGQTFFPSPTSDRLRPFTE